jgi:hypothetical protein
MNYIINKAQSQLYLALKEYQNIASTNARSYISLLHKLYIYIYMGIASVRTSLFASCTPSLPLLLSQYIPQKSTSSLAQMKRKATTSTTQSPKSKKPKPQTQDYCDTPMFRAPDGCHVWPAPDASMIAAQGFIREWYLLFLSYLFL